MTTYYAFERATGKVELVGSENKITGDRSIKGELFAFSSAEKRLQFIKQSPTGRCRQEVKSCEIRYLYLGITWKEMKELLDGLTLNSGLTKADE